MKRMIGLITIAGVTLATGCARFSTKQRDYSYEGKAIARKIDTKATAYTLFAGKSALANWKASQTDKTQGASVGELTQESNVGTNLNSIVESVVQGAVKALTRP